MNVIIDLPIPPVSDNVAAWAASKIVARLAEEAGWMKRWESLDQTSRSKTISYCELTIQASFRIYLSALAGDPEDELRKAVDSLTFFEADGALQDAVVRLVHERVTAACVACPTCRKIVTAATGPQAQPTATLLLVHAAASNAIAVLCGAWEPNQERTELAGEVTCPKCKDIMVADRREYELEKERKDAR